MAEGSRRVVYAALGGNAAIALAKFGAFAFSGSSSMLTEAIHSLVDSTDQLLLLLGQARARKRRDRSHPLGYGMEAYFWSFVVALIVFGAGGVLSIHQGLQRVRSPGVTGGAALNLSVLAIAAVFDGSSFAIGYREYRRIVRGRDVPIWSFIVASKDPSLFATLLEDSAALIGITIATCGVIGSTWLGMPSADGVASIAIGCLLVGVSIVLANETRSLIAGEAVAPPILAEIKGALAASGQAQYVHELATLHLGPRVILVALTMRTDGVSGGEDPWDLIRSITETLKSVDERIGYVYARPAS
jgi:cation diffusion facilitator family transporter